MANNEVKAGNFGIDVDVDVDTRKADDSKPVTRASVEAESNRDVASVEIVRKKVAREFKKQDLVPVSISPLYRPYFGKVMSVIIQGVLVTVPCDGRTYKVPKSFAEEVMIRISNQDELNLKKHKLSDFQNNFEASPGSLSLF